VAHRAPPSEKQMKRLKDLKDQFGWGDIVKWGEQGDLRRGVVFDEHTGEVIFEQWPKKPHETLIHEFTKMFLRQFDRPWENSALYPIFEGEGSQGNITQTFFRCVN
jgi:hypothetical protein